MCRRCLNDNKTPKKGKETNLAKVVDEWKRRGRGGEEDAPLDPLSLGSLLLNPGNRLTEWGISNPPSTAPFKAENTRAPVVHLAKPVSKIHLKGRKYLSPGCHLTFDMRERYRLPSMTFFPGYFLSNPSFFNNRLFCGNNPIGSCE